MKKPSVTLIVIGTLAALLSICLGLMWQLNSLWKTSGYPLKSEPSKRAMTKMESARNSDTSNFDTILQF